MSHHHQSPRFLAVASLFAAALLAGALGAAAQDSNPCVDGVFGGDVGAYYEALYQQNLADPANSFYSTLLPEKQLIVDTCRGKTGPDAKRYTLRDSVEITRCIATDIDGNCIEEATDVIGRIYEHFDPLTGTYYVAVVLSGCYVDNVFGGDQDCEYLESVGWGCTGNGRSKHGHKDLRQSDKVVAEAACEGDPGYSLDPLQVDLEGRPNGVFDGPPPDDADIDWIEQVISPDASLLPPEFHTATSTVWNMTFSLWDVQDSDGDGIDDRLGEGGWASPEPGEPLCDPDGNCQYGYGDTWFDQEHLWEWQVVYEFSWDASGCDPQDPSFWPLNFDQETHASPSKQSYWLCAQRENLGALTVVKDTVPDNPWNKFDFDVTGPTPTYFHLQDWGVNECEPGLQLQDGTLLPDCNDPDAWTYWDRATFDDLVSSDNPVLGGRYTVTESSAEAAGYDTTWECKVIDPGCAASFGDELDWDSCAASSSVCDVDGVFLGEGGVYSGDGVTVPDLPICSGEHVICQFTNYGAGECLESDNAIGDLQVLGGAFDEVSFASAAVPINQSDGPSLIAFSSFTPVADESRWPGTVDLFVQPLPVVENANGDLVPDKSEVCTDSEDTACLAWDAGVEVLDQAPTGAEVANDRHIGTAANQRRVTYTVGDDVDQVASGGQAFAAVPRQLRGFDYADADLLGDEKDLWQGFGINYAEGDPDSEEQARQSAHDIIRKTLEIQQVTLVDPDSGGTVVRDFVVGDTFHADPLLVAGPENFFYLANDLEGNGNSCDSNVDPNRGYRCFYEKQRYRRKALVTSSNDGQVHAYDAGFFQAVFDNGALTGKFDYGTGHELFAHIPRPMLAHTSAMASMEHDFGIDGQLQTADVFVDPIHDGTPDPDEREWRSLVIGSYRNGARGYFALDVTQPDALEVRDVVDPFTGAAKKAFVPVDSGSYVPGCSALRSSLPAGCGTLPYPAVLWEFSDVCGNGGQCDEDANGLPDLGYSWSRANTGRILVEENGETVVKFVAIFGGGLDSAFPGQVGNFLYMVDIETGRAIYKRQLVGSAASEPAAVDTDFNGLIDTIYIGTTAGFMYKADVSVPGIVDETSGRIDDPDQWAPFAIFSTAGRPIFFAPTVLFVNQVGRYAIAFGTGDREDLWSEDGQGVEGRFYVVLDDGFVEGAGVLAGGPLTEADFAFIAAADDATGANFLLDPAEGDQAGWTLQLAPNERVVTEALSLSGLLAFTTFSPVREPPPVCEFGGNGNIYALLVTNANGLSGPNAEDRSISKEGFAGRPIVTRDGMVLTGDGSAGEEGSDPFDAEAIRNIRNSLQSLFPASCRFGNFSLNVGTSMSNRGQVPIAQIPVCVAPKNWKEFF